jgi:hypothetical protein
VKDPSGEIEVLKCILLRETYLARLKSLSRMKEGISKSDVMNTISFIRICTLDTIECILRWRKNQTKSYPFIWNGINYLLKIPSDLDFLNATIVSSWYKIKCKRNPFMLESTLDDRLATPRTDPELDTALDVHSSAYKKQKLGTESSQVSKRSATRSTHVKSPTSAQQVAPSSSTQAGDDVDMLRVRVCEKILLMEENVTGQFVRDESDRLVPLKKLLNSYKHGIAPDASFLLPSIVSEKAITDAPPMSPQSPQSQAIMDESGVKLIMEADDPVGNQRAKKVGGVLYPISLASSSGRKNTPSRQSRGARIDEDISKSRKEIEGLKIQLKALADRIKSEDEVSTTYLQANNDMMIMFYILMCILALEAYVGR